MTRDNVESMTECPACGDKDYDAHRSRRGLCCSCFCSLFNSLGGIDDERVRIMRFMPIDELVGNARKARLAAIARGTSPKTGRLARAEWDSLPEEEKERIRLEAKRRRRESRRKYEMEHREERRIWREMRKNFLLRKNG